MRPNSHFAKATHAKTLPLTVALLQSHYRNASDTGTPLIATDAEVNYLYRVGLAPLAYATFHLDSLSEYAKRLLQGAELTAQVLHEQICLATKDILATAQRIDMPVVLLKGIAIADEFYASPHHRTMCDIDLLVGHDDARRLRESLLSCGFRKESIDNDSSSRERHHHLPVLYDPEFSVPLELHTSLFSHALVRNEPLFKKATLWGHTKPSEFLGISCHRFDYEFQFLYAVAHWAVDQKWAVNLVSINDVLLMLRGSDRTMDWHKVATLLEQNPRCADFVAVLLLFLRDAELADVPRALEPIIAKSTQRIGKTNLRALHWLMTQFPFSGRRRVNWFIGRVEAQVIWITLLEPRHRFLRSPLAVVRALWRRIRTLLGIVRRSVFGFTGAGRSG